MTTIKKFYDDVYLKEAKANIISIIKNGENPCEFLVELDSTIFFPTGGGQSCDLGKLGGFDVIDVSEKDGHIYHLVQICDPSLSLSVGSDSSSASGSATSSISASSSASASADLPTDDEGNPLALSLGSEVTLTLDWERRFDNMQRHCGEHILSGIFFKEYGGVNRGFHMGKDFMTIDIVLEENPDYTKLTYEMCKHVEFLANQVIWSNAPVTRRVYESKEETLGLPLRKILTIDTDISIVCVGSPENAADCVACCGTHPAFAGQVGLIKIFKVEPNKGMFRVYCEAGARAYKDYELKHDVLTVLTNRYSTSADKLLEQIAREDEKIKALRNDLYILRNSVIKERAATINADISVAVRSGCIPSSQIFVYEYDDMKIDDLLAIGRAITVDIPKLLLFIAPRENTLLLFSNGKACDCAKLVKDNAHIYNGKGGGNATSSRAIFPNREYLNTFIDLLEKHLR